MKKIQLINELLTEQLNHWMLFPIALTMMEMTRGQTGMKQPDLLLWICCGLFPLCFFAIRLSYSRNHKILVFLLRHIAAAICFTLALVVFRQAFVSRFISILCGTGYMLHSLRMQFKKASVFTTAMQFPIGAAIAFVAPMIKHTNQWNQYYIFSLIWVVALFFISFYIKQYLDFMSLNKNGTGNLPLGAIFRSGTGMVLGYTLFGTVVLIVSTRFQWLEELLRPVFYLLGQFLRKVLKIIFSRTKPGEEMTVLEQETSPFETPQLPSPNEASGFWHVLEIIVIIAMAAGFAFIVIKLFSKLLCLLQGYLDRRLSGSGEEEPETGDFREPCGRKKSLLRKKVKFSETLSNRERIRKLYKRKLLVSALRLPQCTQGRAGLGRFTAREWETLLNTQGMADLYELARYSQCDMTADHVRQMKEACSEKKK